MIRRAAPAPFSRRKLLRDAAALASAGAAGIGPAIAAAARENAARVRGYGRLLPDPGRRLNLPPGFRYRIISRAGQPMSDGLQVPGLPDGMHAFGDPSGTTRVLRNHELHPGSPETAYAHLAGGP
ncbi:MAG TPA: alkaline phosphatase PhoX, partial [Gammaproteobacteria bacterium]